MNVGTGRRLNAQLHESLHRLVATNCGHRVLDTRNLQLPAVARWCPIGFTGRTDVDEPAKRSGKMVTADCEPIAMPVGFGPLAVFKSRTVRES